MKLLLKAVGIVLLYIIKVVAFGAACFGFGALVATYPGTVFLVLGFIAFCFGVNYQYSKLKEESE